VAVGLDETFIEPGDDFSPQSMQPVIHLNEDSQRQIEMMRWAFKDPIISKDLSGRIPHRKRSNRL